MRIEEGKSYRTRGGRKVGPVSVSKNSRYPFEAMLNGTDPAWYRDDGTCPFLPMRDAVALWSEGPVRTVQRIVPGTYDGVEVGPEVTGHPQREVMIRIATDHGPMVCMDHEALTRAAAVLTALAGALRDE